MQLSIFCPYCIQYTSVDILKQKHNSASNNFVGDVYWRDSDRNDTWWMGKCNHCSGVLLILNDGHEIYPTPQPSPTNPKIPEIIRTDIHEAKKCLSVSSFNATVVMARRALQSICLNKGATAGKKLFQQIDEIRNSGIITEDLKVWAHEIRYVGNDGAHPGDMVTKQDADSILKLAEQFAHIIYVVPEMAKELKEKRESKGK